MAKSYWQVLPKLLIDKIEAVCCENQEDSSSESMIGDLQEFASSEVLKELNFGMATTFKSEINLLKPDKLNRALNRRSDNGVFIKDGNKKLLNFLCYYAYKMNWRDTLTLLDLDEDLLEKRIVSKKITSQIEQNKSHIVVKIYREQKQTLTYVKKIENNLNTLEYDDITKLYNAGTKVALDLQDEYGEASLNKVYADFLIKTNQSIELAKKLLMKCLRVFSKIKYFEAELYIKERLAEVEILLGNYLSAELYISEYINSTIEKTLYQHAIGYFTAANISQNIGDYRQRDQYLMKVKTLAFEMLESSDEINIKEGRYFLNHINYTKGLYKKQEGYFDEAKVYFEKIKDTAVNPDEFNILINSLFQLSEIEIINGNFISGKWLDYLLNIKSLARENKEFHLLALTICHIAQLSIDRSEIEIALEILEDGLKEILDTKNSRAINYYNSKYVQVYLIRQDYEKAEELLVQYLNSIEGKDQRANENNTFLNLINIHIETGNEEKKQKYIDILFQKYNKRLLEEISEYEKGECYVAIGDLQFINKNYIKSKISYSHAKNIFKSNKYLGMEAEVLLKMMECENECKKYEAAYKIALSVIKLVKDTSFYFSYFKGCMYCASYNLHNDISKAEMYLYEVNILDKKFNFQQHNLIYDMLGYLSIQKKQSTLSKISLMKMMGRLNEGLISHKSKKESIIRFWYYKYRNELFAEIKNSVGLKSVIFTNDLNLIINLRNGLSWLFQWFSIISSIQIEDEGVEENFIYPFNEIDKDEIFGLAFSKKHRTLPKEQSNEEKLKIKTSLNSRSYNRAPMYWVNYTKDKKESLYVSGIKYCLPQIAYDLIDYCLESNNLVEGNMLVIPFQTNSIQDKILYELWHCISLGSFPIYINELPQNSNVTIISSLKVFVPFGKSIQNDIAYNFKKSLNLLSSLTYENIEFIMNSLKIEFENMLVVNTKHIGIDIFIASLPEIGSTKNKYWPIFVAHLQDN
ncbi:MAG: tetratricopeptide repeat protein [Candidatus Pacearchaeota archaeon]